MDSWSGKFVDMLKQQMKIDRTVTSRPNNTKDSIKHKTTGTTLIRTNILSDSHKGIPVLELIDKGFHPKYAPPWKRIEQWMKDKNVQPKRKGKFVKRTDLNYKRAAMGIASAIGERGGILRFGGGSNILNFTFKRIEMPFLKGLLVGYKRDIDSNIERNTKRVVK